MAFINGIGCVSPQRTWDRGNFPGEVQEYNTRMIQCMEPEVDTGLDDKYLRRMNRLLRLGWTAAKLCLDDAGNIRPDAVITGSGWGSVQDSEKFLLSIYKNKENFLPPTPFIQSTHNALGSQIAILLESYHYNMAYAHSSFAFEHALQDSLLRLRNGESRNVLAGGFDEITANHFTLFDRAGWWRKEAISNLELLKTREDGTICGEGFGFFFLQNERNENTYAELGEVETQSVIKINATDSQINKRLKETKIDWVFAGMNGDMRYDHLYGDAISKMFPEGVNIAAYKHLCGESLTSSAFAVWAAANAIRKQHVPDIFRIKSVRETKEIRNILIFNHFKGKHVSLILLSKPQ